MNKRVLIIYYSQTGQLRQIVNNFAQPFESAMHEVEYITIEPEKPFPFPWDNERFFDAMPECVTNKPMAIKPITVRHDKYDLIVFAWQPWFLSPSLPAIAAMYSDVICALIKNTPVITIAGSRNMWIQAQERIRQWLKKNQAIHVGNLVLKDKAPNLISAVTVQYWMLTGKKDKMWGIFPKPGIADDDIASAVNFGLMACQALEESKLEDLHKNWLQKGAVQVNTTLMFIESRAIMLFRIWAKIILSKKNRNLWINIFRYYLLFALFIISPIVIVLFTLIIRPLLYKKLAQQKIYAEGVNLRG
ncbi:MAG: hypothetical protein BWX95_00528 [Bacteroidetes bacterium ADurb.Bin141]|nr:MAG: hypothetical protein BWX95_00528 [Bacteroidetes bacterium ADurb.Bin141]